MSSPTNTGLLSKRCPDQPADQAADPLALRSKLPVRNVTNPSAADDRAMWCPQWLSQLQHGSRGRAVSLTRERTRALLRGAR
jgi:hypothetical protein